MGTKFTYDLGQKMKLLVLAIVIWVASAAVFQTPLTKIESLKQKLLREGKWTEYKKHRDLIHAQRFAQHKKAIKTPSVRAIVNQPVNDYADVQYVANITIGTPEQTFRVVLDAKTANLWIPDKSCGSNGTCDSKVCNPTQQLVCMAICPTSCCNNTGIQQCGTNKKYFDSSSSSTYQANGQKFIIEYDSGENFIRKVDGFLGVDTVRLGDKGTTQLVIPKTTIGQTTAMDIQFEQNTHYDGYLGLGFQSDAVDNVVPPLINAINQKILDQPVFTVALFEEGNQNNVPGGVFTWGGHDTTNCGPVTEYVKLSRAKWFQYEIKSATFNAPGNQIFHNCLDDYDQYDEPNCPWTTVSDTASPFISGPLAIVEDFAKAVNALYIQSDEVYYMDCNTDMSNFNLQVTLWDATVLTIPGQQLLMHWPNGKCVFGINANKEGNGYEANWIFGAPFMRTYCNYFDYGQQRIGFAKNNHNKF